MFNLRRIATFGITFGLFLSIFYLPPENVGAEPWTIELFQTLIGNSTISSLGDINGDGFDDIGVSDFYLDYKRVFVYFGGGNINSEPDLILTSPEIMDDFGCAISSAGDINNDGYCDMIIGAYNSDIGGDRSGRAYIFYGGDPFDKNPDVILQVEDHNYLGWSVSTLYDINKDGYDDVIVGAPKRDNTGNSWDGRACIFYGGNPMDTDADLVVDGNRTCLFGYSVSSTGDVNNDGWIDFIVGEPGNNDDDIGAAYIYFGGPSMDNISDINLTNGLAGDDYGTSVSSAGDFNRDGYYDVIVGAPHNDDKYITAGKAYLYLGGPLMDNITDKSWEGRKSGSGFGQKVINSTDIDKDGYNDIMISALGDGSNEATNSGNVYIYFGGEDLGNIRELTVYGIKDFELFGSGISSGDVNGDGYYDILVASKKNGYIFGPNLAPSIEIFEPNGISDLTDTSYLITWNDWDPDDNATILLYYLSIIGSNPVVIIDAWNIMEDDETDQFLWNTSSIIGGSYYIKAKIDDGINPWVWAYSPGKVTINHHPTITITAPEINNNIAHKNFTITWVDKDDEDNATISLYYDTNNIGNDGTQIVSDISEDNNFDMYIWNTTDMVEGEYYIYAEIDDGINPPFINYSTIPLIIHHKMPVLNITEIEFSPSSPRDGEDVEISTTILNSGDGLSTNIVVKLLVDGIEMSETIIEEILPNNNTFEVIFDPIILDKGSHIITVKVIYDDNQITKDELLKVKEKPIDILNILLIIVVSLIVIIVVIIIIIYKRKRGKESINTGNESISSSMDQISCPQCNHMFYIPTGSRPLQVQCPNCGAKGIIK